MKKCLHVFFIAVSLGLLCSCGKQESPKTEIRAIQYMKIGELANKNLRKFSGVIYARDSSYVSFEDIGGKVKTVNVQIGEKVKKGQVLATLDTEKFELAVNDAEAELKKAEAQMTRSTSDYERERELFRKDASFQKKLDSMKFEHDSAVSNEKSAKAKVGLAIRNLRNTKLQAPFDGDVGERLVEPNQVIAVGHKIFRIDASGALEVHFDIPENLHKRVSVGMTGSVSFPGIKSSDAQCEISYLGTAAGNANSFPVKALLPNPPAGIKPGMTAEVSLHLPIENRQIPGLVIPLKALLPGKNVKSGYVFVYNPQTSTVKKVEVSGAGSQGNFGVVNGAIQPGDIIATAGVSFLTDGMKVKLYEPDKNETDASGEQ